MKFDKELIDLFPVFLISDRCELITFATSNISAVEIIMIITVNYMNINKIVHAKLIA